ncbi:MAG: hypothetical protein ACLPUT_13375 [Solirubrobacteraceae bacterium]|jgi:hypothetical protein
MKTRHIPRRLLLGPLAVLIVASTTTAFSLASTGSGSPEPTAPTVKQVPAKIAAEFPALRKAIDQSEAQQIPAVEKVMDALASRDESSEIGGANSELARRVSQDGENAEYVVPGNEVVCMVSISVGHATGGGCAQASSVEQTGTTSLTVVPGGYEVSGILPTGTTTVSIANTIKQTTVVTANANHAFEFYSAAPLEKLSYALPGGGEHEGSLELPGPPGAPPAPAG